MFGGRLLLGVGAIGAAVVLSGCIVFKVEPVAVQLRYLQTLTEIGVEQNTTVVFPIPLEMMRAFLNINLPQPAPVKDQS